jgi:hypothetical protein
MADDSLAGRVYEGARLRPMLLKEKPRYCVGVDLGQAQDFTAIVVVETARLTLPERDPITWSFRAETIHHVRHAERVPLEVPYPDVAEHVRKLAGREPLAGQATVVVDATGVGAPVVDLLRRGGLGCRVIPVVITGGDTESSDGVKYRVPKRDLMAGLQVAFQKRRLRLAEGLWALRELQEELRSMRLRVSADGFERYGGRGHDDLVLALALAWWRASREAR